MKNLFLTLALVLVAAFAFANTKNDVKTETINQTTVAENIPLSVCVGFVNGMEEDYGGCFSDALWNSLVDDCVG